MSGLSDLLQNPERVLRRVKQAAPQPLSLQRAAHQLGGAGAGMKAVEDVEELQRRVALALSSEGELRSRDIREACQVYFHPPKPLGRDDELSARLIDRVVKLQRRAPMLALVDAYLDRFDGDDEDVNWLASQLQKLCPSWPWRPGTAWPERAERFELFDPARAPRRIAEAILGSDDPPQRILDSAGLDTDVRRKGGLAEAAFRSGCTLAAAMQGPPAQPVQERIIEWAHMAGTPLAYPQSWSFYARSLFAPWRRTEPSDEHRRALIDAATAHAADPRINETRWRPVKSEFADVYEVIVRWLTKASVEQFFEIVSETMRDRPDMWRARRKFWTDYLRANLISAAWVAFGSDGAWRADDAARRSNEPAMKMFGRLSSGGGRTAEHAALIMQIGDLIVVDWSHNGSWNIWPMGSKNRPVLFRHNSRGLPDYHPHDLMNGPITGSHTANGSWQYRVRDIVRDQTGLRP